MKMLQATELLVDTTDVYVTVPDSFIVYPNIINYIGIITKLYIFHENLLCKHEMNNQIL